MKALAILGLTLLGFYLMTVQLGFLSFFCAIGAWKLIDTDRNGQSIDDLMAYMFGFIILGGLLALIL